MPRKEASRLSKEISLSILATTVVLTKLSVTPLTMAVLLSIPQTVMTLASWSVQMISLCSPQVWRDSPSILMRARLHR